MVQFAQVIEVELLAVGGMPEDVVFGLLEVEIDRHQAVVAIDPGGDDRLAPRASDSDGRGKHLDLFVRHPLDGDLAGGASADGRDDDEAVGADQAGDVAMGRLVLAPGFWRAATASCQEIAEIAEGEPGKGSDWPNSRAPFRWVRAPGSSTRAAAEADGSIAIASGQTIGGGGLGAGWPEVGVEDRLVVEGVELGIELPDHLRGTAFEARRSSRTPGVREMKQVAADAVPEGLGSGAGLTLPSGLVRSRINDPRAKARGRRGRWRRCGSHIPELGEGNLGSSRQTSATRFQRSTSSSSTWVPFGGDLIQVAEDGWYQSGVQQSVPIDHMFACVFAGIEQPLLPGETS